MEYLITVCVGIVIVQCFMFIAYYVNAGFDLIRAMKKSGYKNIYQVIDLIYDNNKK